MTALLRLPPTEDDRMARIKFLALLRDHRKAVIVPEGAHFDAIGTDIDFNTEVYTRRIHG
jgi:hypothetical protein